MARRSTSVLLSALALVALAAAAALVAPPGARAEVDGPCQATIAGENVAAKDVSATGEPITVEENARVPVTMTSTRPITALKVEIEFAGIGWAVHDEPTEGRSWAKTVNVADYSTYGVGLYKIVGSSTGQAFSCTAAALVEVGGSPLTTVAGLVAIGLAVVGALGLLWVLFRGPSAAPLVGAVLGVLLALGAAVLLQQFAILYPTMIVALVALGGGALLGIVCGLFGRSRGLKY